MGTPLDKTVALMTGALNAAASAMSRFLGDRVLRIADVSLSHCAFADLPALCGPEETPVACAAFDVKGDLEGFLIMLLPLDLAEDFVEVLLGGLGTLDDDRLVESVFGELGNVVSSSFVNHVADVMRLRVKLSPPDVSQDMVGALLGTLAGSLAHERDAEVPVVHTKMMGAAGELSAYLLWIPGEPDLRRLEAPV